MNNTDDCSQTEEFRTAYHLIIAGYGPEAWPLDPRREFFEGVIAGAIAKRRREAVKVGDQGRRDCK